MPFQIIRNDICRVKADAIVNTANPGITYGRGTDQAIYEAAGITQLLEARRRIGEIAPGDAAVTPGFQLPAGYIIHAVGSEWQGGTAGEEELLASCYRRALALAEELGCRSVAFPLISAGVYGFPKDLALQIAHREIRRFLENSDIEILLVVYDPEVFALSQGLQDQVRQYIDDHYVERRRTVQMSTPEPPGGRTPGKASAVPSGHAPFEMSGNIPFAPSKAARRPGAVSRPYEERRESEKRQERRRPLREIARRAREELDRRRQREEELSREEEFRRKESLRREEDVKEEFLRREEDVKEEVLTDYAEEEYDSELSEEISSEAEEAVRPPGTDAGGAVSSVSAGTADSVSGPPEPRAERPRKAAAEPFSGTCSDMPAPAVPSRRERELSELMSHVGETFRECLMRYIDERNLTDAYVYKRANIDRKLFSKIRCNEDYMPRKRTVVALAFALELSLDETVDLLRKAGMALAPGSRFDLIVRFCLENEIYDLYEVNVLLFLYKQPLLGC